MLGIGALVVTMSAWAAAYEHALIIIADDLGSDKVGAYAGDVTNPAESRPATPTIDLLADAGVRFTDAWVLPVCSPTRASLFTGENAYRHGLGTVVSAATATELPLSPVSLQQLAEDAGLQTALFGKWHVGTTADSPRVDTSPFDYAEYAVQTGFGTFRGSTGAEPASYLDWLYIVSVPDAAWSSGYVTSARTETTSVTDRTTQDALVWLRTQAGARRLAVVSYNLVHNSDDADGPAGAKSWEDAVASCGGTPTGVVTDDYHLAAECLDEAVYDLLSNTPGLDETLVVFIGDNGTPNEVAEGHFDDGRGKKTVYESGVRVPFILADGAALRATLASGGTLPAGVYGIDAGVETDEPASVIDLYATIADLLDLDPGTCTVGVDCARDSVSLRPVLTGGASARAALWTETFKSAGGVVSGSGAVRIGDAKLIVSTTSGCRDYALYDLVGDRWESSDLFDAPEYATERAALLEELETHADRMSGTAYDWLSFDACCREVEVWYDGVDSDCNGASDYDADADGHDALAYGGTDCDDVDASVFAGASDTWYDGVDSDCDGAWEFDADGDGHDPVVYGGDDCDDARPDVYPGADDAWYDGVDSDCDGASDYDADGDGHDPIAYGGDDCDDAREDVYAGADDVWYDGVDSNCDGAWDFDADGDGQASMDFGGRDCDDTDAAAWVGAPDEWYDGVDSNCDSASDFDADGDGHDTREYGGDDCDDRRADVYPGADDAWYDGVDGNCDGAIDFDADGDGQAAAAFGGRDCDDADASIFVGASEVWYDGVDANCDDSSDYDADGDGYDSEAFGGPDCDDARSDVSPDGIERWYDGVDQDCDGASDYDADGDGYDALAYGGADCDDGHAYVHPGAEDPSGGVDADCDPDVHADTGGTGETEPPQEGGCACGTRSGGTAGAGAPALLALGVLLARRRERTGAWTRRRRVMAP